LIATVGLLTVASLSLLAWTKLAGPEPIAPGDTATLDGMSVQVGGSEWAVMNMVENSQGGYLMPDQMMPGAPTGGEVRLGVSVTMFNTRSSTLPVSLVDEFMVSGGLEPEPKPLSADTVGELRRLAPGSAVQGTLYFDVAVPEEADPTLPPLYLHWTRGGDTIRIPVQLPGDVPEHQGH
jgi:hypothetical protein